MPVPSGTLMISFRLVIVKVDGPVIEPSQSSASSGLACDDPCLSLLILISVPASQTTSLLPAFSSAAIASASPCE